MKGDIGPAAHWLVLASGGRGAGITGGGGLNLDAVETVSMKRRLHRIRAELR